MAKDGGGVGGGSATNPKGSKRDKGTVIGSGQGSKRDPGTSLEGAGSLDLIATLGLTAFASALAGILSGLSRRSR